MRSPGKGAAEFNYIWSLRTKIAVSGATSLANFTAVKRREVNPKKPAVTRAVRGSGEAMRSLRHYWSIIYSLLSGVASWGTRPRGHTAQGAPQLEAIQHTSTYKLIVNKTF